MLRGRRMNPEFSNTQPVEIRFHHRVDIAQFPLRLVPPATLLEADKEVDKLPQRPVKAGAPPKANIPHTGEAIVTHVAGIGDPSLQSAVFVINDKLMGARPAGRSGTWRSGTDCMAVDASTWAKGVALLPAGDRELLAVLAVVPVSVEVEVAPAGRRLWLEPA